MNLWQLSQNKIKTSQIRIENPRIQLLTTEVVKNSSRHLFANWTPFACFISIIQMYYLSGSLGVRVEMNGCKFSLHLKISIVNPSPHLVGKLGFSTLLFLIYSKFSSLYTVSDLS